MRNDGTEAQDAFVARKEALPRVVVERFRDAKDLRGINRGRAVGDFPKPADFLVTENGSIHYAEVKSTSNPRRFSFGQIETGQRSAALRQAKAGGDYRFYLFSYGLGEWFVMSAETYAAAVDRGDVSIKFEDLPKWQ